MTLATITSQYNQPRYESGIKRVHIGVDLQALNSNNLGRNVFSVYGAGKVVATGTSPSYGEYVTIEHKHTSGGKEYYFQSFYAHLASRTLTSTTPTYTTPYTQQVGVEGRTAQVYRLKGQYDSKTNNITVYHFLFFNEYYED